MIIVLRSHSLPPTPKKMQEAKHTILILVLLVLVLNGCAQNLPPAKYDGFLYENRRVDPDSILIEAFFDPVCPDSRDAWPPLKQALAFYGPHVSLAVHLLPLPYHDNAFVTSRAVNIVNQLKPSATFPVLEWFFKNQERYYNLQTRNISRASIVKDLVKQLTEVIGGSYNSALAAGFNDRKTDLTTRVSFKYSTSRGVYGTPTFYVNGFVLPDAGDARDFNGWKKVLEPLVRAPKKQESLHFFL